MKIQYSILAILLLAIYIWGTYCQGYKVNINMHSTDQAAYLNYAKKISQTDFRHMGDRNRMPVYPAILSFFYKDGMSDKTFFEIGKKVNVCISIVVLIIFYCILIIYNHPFDSLTAVLVTAFTVFAYKAPYFKAEILFYCINFILFVLISSLLSKPRLKIAFLIGLTGGIAHLTKASVLPALILCLVFLSGIILGNLYKRFYLKKSYNEPLSRSIQTPVLCGLIVGFVFLIVVSPYIRNSKEHFGKYFYNVNTTFYMWYDSWEEVKEGTRAFGDRIGWPDMPEDKLPGLTKYMQSHSFRQISTRFFSGLHTVNYTIYKSYGYIFFIIIYIIFLAAMFLHNWKNILLRKDLCKKSLQLFFYISFFASYYLMFAWYTPIASGNRFVLALFMPFLFLLIRLLNYARHHNLSFNFGSRKIHPSVLSPLILVILILYMIFVFPFSISTIYGGS